MARTVGRKATDKEYLEKWLAFCDSLKNVTPINYNETRLEKLRRIARLEKNPEEWFKYYFPNFYTSEPAKFHTKSSKLVVDNAELFLVRAWSRELAKSARTMMEVIYLVMTKRAKNILMVSNSSSNAERLLLPFKANFENNARLIFDYGIQKTVGKWTAEEFKLRVGASFRAVGSGQSPRGTRNDAIRPDTILIDDFDTDEECRNEEIMKAKIKWIEQALIPTRSISNPTRIIVCGNIIHENCAVLYMGKKADKFEIINVRDEQGKSTWPNKNTEEMIDRVLSSISYESAQKEYFNNPMDGGDVFKNIAYNKVPNLKGCNVLIYCDPATSNKKVSKGSDKVVGLLANKGFDYFIVKVRIDTMTTASFIDAMFELHRYATLVLKAANVPVWVENNSLQDPFFEQVFRPAIYEKALREKYYLPIMLDSRGKEDKYSRVEGLLEPLNRNGHLIFNEAEKEDPNMKRLEAQFKSFSRKQKKSDGPDMVEGGVFKLKEKAACEANANIQAYKPIRTKKI